MRWSWCLFPFAVIYDAITRWRNHLYDRGIIPATAFEANVIAVGNLSVGGTGKTPLVTFLIDHFLARGRSVATLSRGYGRSTSGFILADHSVGVGELGDEPAMYRDRYGERVKVSVCEDRALAIPRLLSTDPSIEVILLDDAFQHRTVSPSLSVMLTSYHKPFFRDYVLPVGRLREARRGASRADVILVTKCPPDPDESVMTDIRQNIARYAPNTPVYFTYVCYGECMALQRSASKQEIQRIVGVAGIADPHDFFEFLSDRYDLIVTRSFRDHQVYDERMVRQLDQMALRRGCSIVMTEKDAVKWRPWLSIIRSQVYYVPVSIGFVYGEREFLDWVDSGIEKYKRDY